MASESSECFGWYSESVFLPQSIPQNFKGAKLLGAWSRPYRQATGLHLFLIFSAVPISRESLVVVMLARCHIVKFWKKMCDRLCLFDRQYRCLSLGRWSTYKLLSGKCDKVTLVATPWQQSTSYIIVWVQTKAVFGVLPLPDSAPRSRRSCRLKYWSWKLGAPQLL